MTLISENPWALIYACLIVAVVGLVALKLTQRGMFLWVALGALGLAGLLALVDWAWVTDGERVEQVVRALARAAARSDGNAVAGLLDPQVSLCQEGDGGGGEIAKGPAAVTLIKAKLANIKFDYVRVHNLQTTADSVTGQGKCDFQVDSMGSAVGNMGTLNFMTGPAGSDWSLGFVKAPDGAWKVQRITAVRLPGRVNLKQF